MIKKLILGVAVLLVLASGILWYLWRQATALPDWYAEADPTVLEELAGGDVDEGPAPRWIPLDEAGEQLADPPSEEDREAARTVAPGEPTAAPRARPRRKRPVRHELRGFHRRAKGGGKSAVKASRALLEDGRLEAGVVLDLSRVPKNKLSPRDRALYDRAVRQFPGLARRDVYVGIVDRPISDAGVLQLGPHPTVRVGKLSYPLDQAARKLGMKPAELRHELDRELRRLGFTDPGG